MLFELPWPMPDEIRLADDMVLKAEAQQLMTLVDEWDSLVDVDPADIEVRCLSPDKARHEFLLTYQMLMEG